MQAIRLLILAAWLMLGISGFCQPSRTPPEVGKMMPDFAFSKVKHFGNKKHVSRDDFRGKWLMLDLWSVTCTACVQTFPKINDLQNEFADKVQFFLVGQTGKDNENIERLFEKVSRNKSLDLPIAFDSTTFIAWDVESVPHIYIIDPAGLLRFIVDGRDFTPEKIRALVEEKQISFFPKRRYADMPKFNLTNVLGEDELVTGSVLTRWSRQRQGGYGIDYFVRNKQLWKDGWSVGCAPLFWLFNLAYFGKDLWGIWDNDFYGKISVKPILELSDSSAFDFDFTHDVGKGIYNFSVKLPDERVSRHAILTELQKCLQNAFGYSASIEMRERPVWKLIAIKEVAKLKTKGETPLIEDEAGTGYTLKNQDVRTLLAAIQSYLHNEDWLPFMDETGISGNIDIALDADLTSFEGVRKELQRHGLDLVKAKRRMKVLVIREGDQ